jgi:hypothetical protein
VWWGMGSAIPLSSLAEWSGGEGNLSGSHGWAHEAVRSDNLIETHVVVEEVRFASLHNHLPATLGTLRSYIVPPRRGHMLNYAFQVRSSPPPPLPPLLPPLPPLSVTEALIHISKGR